MITLNYIASFFLIVLGLYCIVMKYNLVKTVIGLSIRGRAAGGQLLR